MTNEEAIRMLRRIQEPEPWMMQLNEVGFEALEMAIKALEKMQTLTKLIEAYDLMDLSEYSDKLWKLAYERGKRDVREWNPCSEPPKHHRNVLVRGIEAIGNVTVYKVMQWDVDRWRPTDYAPSIQWTEWSEIEKDG